MPENAKLKKTGSETLGPGNRILSSAVEIRRAAMDLLARRDYARRELHRKLSPRVDHHDLLNSVLDQLVVDGLQNDRRFAEAYTRFRRLKGIGPVRIKAELRKKGISENLLAQIVDKGDPCWLETAKTILQKKYGEAAPISATDKAKRMRFLSYRGFEYDHIEAVIKE